jgi:hypothetical protein
MYNLNNDRMMDSSVVTAKKPTTKTTGGEPKKE